MIGKLRAHIERSLELHRLVRKRQKKFKRWLARYPGSTYAHFYAESTRRSLEDGTYHPTLGTKNVNEAWVKARAQAILADFKRAGCSPQHVMVDYGCGSLWIGEAFMEYLDPGNYIGLDVADFFYREGLARLGPDFVASRTPDLSVIDEQSLARVRDRHPDFILSTNVMRHVPSADLAGYFSRIASLAGPETRIEICDPVVFWPWGRRPTRWWHTPFAIRRALAPLGYVAEYSAERRIMPGKPGFSMVRR